MRISDWSSDVCSSDLVYLAAVIGVGLFISSLAQTQQQAVLGAFLFSSPAILLSGFAPPIENMPDWLQAATVINPIDRKSVVSGKRMSVCVDPGGGRHIKQKNKITQQHTTPDIT